MNDRHQVIIVGGGPVGLWLSCELRLTGLSVIVLERRTERINQSRALTLHGRSLEMLSLRGIEERFLKVGRPIGVGHYAVLETRLNFSIFDSKYPYTLMIPQAATEELIEQHALALGVEIRRGITVDSVVAHDEDVVVSGTVGTERYTFAASYVVGADGGRSVVRREAGIGYEGYPATGVWLMGDVVLGEPPAIPMHSVFSEKGLVMVAALPDGKHHRVILAEADNRGVKRDDPTTFEDLEQVTERIAGTTFAMRDPTWISRFDNETRLATHYRSGRIFLAGDAAHIHLPAGGQGMSVGIQDAMNLGWKLAGVIKGEAPEALLDTYEEERRPVGVYLHDTTMAQGWLMTNYSPYAIALRGVFNDMLRVPEINAYFAYQVSGFGVRYPKPLLGGETSGSSRVGERIPDVGLKLADGTETRLYGLLSTGRWLHLSLESGARVDMPEWIAPRSVVLAEGVVTESTVALANVKAILLRPDGYIADVLEVDPASELAAA